jgi:uncharacterized protein
MVAGRYTKSLQQTSPSLCFGDAVEFQRWVHKGRSIVESQIGQTLQKYHMRSWFAAVVAATTVASYMWLFVFIAHSQTRRIILVVIAVCMIVVLCRGDRSSLGIMFRMTPSYKYWIKMTLLIGAVVALFFIIASIVFHFAKIHYLIPAMRPDRFFSSFWRTCIFYPILEEALFRFILCVSLVAIVGPRVTILLSGAIFAALHFLYGNPGPDNFIAGYFLAWAFLKSGSIATPIILHSLGNACALAVWVIHWQMIS